MSVGRTCRAWLGAILLLAATGCGSANQGEATAGDALTASDVDGIEPTMTAEPPPGWTVAVPEAQDLRIGDDDTDLVLGVRVSPVRLTDRTCGASDPAVLETEEVNAEIVWLQTRVIVPNVIADESLLRWADEFGECAAVDVELEVDVGAPLANRDVVVDQVRWVADSNGRFTPCELPACDPSTGEPPVVARCDGGSLAEDVRLHGDVGRHAAIGETRCADGWAMVEVDIGAGACPASDAGPNPCSGQRIDRLFLRAGVPSWEVVTRSRSAGCTDVHQVAPEFPLALCADLAPIG